MNKRNFVRYGCDVIPGGMREVTISWQDGSSVVSKVVNYSAHGVRVSVPSLPAGGLPQKKDLLLVEMPVGQAWFSGMCVFAEPQADGSLSVGIYFYKPEEQNHLQRWLFKSLAAPHPSGTFVSYEWEERVARLCASDDPTLQKIGEEKLRALGRTRQQASPPTVR